MGLQFQERRIATPLQRERGWHTESIETRSLPTLTHCFPRNFTFYVAHPIPPFASGRRRKAACLAHGS